MGRPVDLVYNRLTDFYLQSPAVEALRSAYEAGAIDAHAAPARSRAVCRQAQSLAAERSRTPCRARRPAVRDRLSRAWHSAYGRGHARARRNLVGGRRDLFFKPASGFGSRAAYRGDKLTRRVWQGILGGGYVAQRFAIPSERRVRIDGTGNDLKLDIRAYVAGEIQLVAARLYMGQTTNFRTPGGGFAPVFLASAVGFAAAPTP